MNNRTLGAIAGMVAALLGMAATALPRASGASAAPDEFAELKRQISERPNWNNARLQQETLRPAALILAADVSPCDVVWRRTGALLRHLRGMPAAPDLSAEAAELESLDAEVAAVRSDCEARQRAVFEKLTGIRRRVAFKNPLLDFSSIIFLAHNKQARGDVHMVDQYLGFNAEKRGGVYVLDGAFSAQPRVRSVLAHRRVEKGRLKGQILEDRGGFVSLDLDYDGRSILFAFTEAQWQVPAGVRETSYWTTLDARAAGAVPTPAHYIFRPEGCYHLFRAGIDGSGLTQLSDGPFNDFDPCFLPSGRMVFVSSRSGGQCRCGERPLPTFTLHGMMPDGSDIIQLSWHDTNEWQPSVDNSGMLVYTRWDYVDRDSDVAHHFWRCYPDGRDPRSPHGNYPDVRESRPWMELSLRAVPGSTRYVGVAAPHHGEAYGSLVLIDLQRREDGKTGQIRRITPEALFPEAESAPGVPHPGQGKHAPRGEVYGTPWPLGEDFYLCVCDPGQRNYGLYLLDSFGNCELLYRNPEIACLRPIPLRARPRPPVIPVATAQSQADRRGTAVPATAEVAVMNVYESRRPWPQNVRIKQLRVVNLFAKENAVADVPPIGVAAQSLCRGVLGVAPVEPDGSAHFTLPAGAPVYFQLLDEKGLMVQTMRSATYAHPGERLTCAGCHESPQKSPPAAKAPPLALRRGPSPLEPEASGSYPLSFPRLVQPVLDAQCVACHDREKKAPKLHGDRLAKTGRSEAFESLRPYAWGMSGGNGTAVKHRQYSLPGQQGARVSRLYGLLARGHYDVNLSPENLRRITLWLDCNSNFFGAYHDPEQQADFSNLAR
jgi:cytochrome c553